ncbi:unnamed protein product [Auanema sp. JU1783]|nr:unnamed protein product [Auanema sp. JU1783]
MLLTFVSLGQLRKNSAKMFTDWNETQWKSFALGCFWVVLSFVSFRLIQFCVRWYLFGKCTFRTFSYFGLRGRNRNTDSRELTAVPPNKKWRISNEVVSLLHSVISGLWAAYALLYYQKLTEDMIGYRCELAVNLLFLSGGYLLHDLVDLLVNEQSARIMELLFHHFIVLSGFTTTLITEKYLGVVIFGLLMELNSIFLHSRSLLNLYGMNKKSTSFRIIALLNMVTLVLFRLGVSIYLLYWAFTNVSAMKWYVGIITFIVILSLFSTNSVLSYRVMAADGLLGKKRARKPRGTESTIVEGEAVNTIEENEADEEEEEDVPHEVAVQTDVRTLVDSSTQPTIA